MIVVVKDGDEEWAFCAPYPERNAGMCLLCTDISRKSS